MPDSQKVFGCAGSYRISEGRLVIVAEPAPVPRRAQLPPPLVLAQRPCCATPAMSMSSSGFDDRFDRFPHSEPRPARLPVALVQVPAGVTGTRPPSPQEAAYATAAESLASPEASRLPEAEASVPPPPPSDPWEPASSAGLAGPSMFDPASEPPDESPLEQPQARARRTLAIRTGFVMGPPMRRSLSLSTSFNNVLCRMKDLGTIETLAAAMRNFCTPGTPQKS